MKLTFTHVWFAKWFETMKINLGVLRTNDKRVEKKHSLFSMFWCNSYICKFTLKKGCFNKKKYCIKENSPQTPKEIN